MKKLNNKTLEMARRLRSNQTDAEAFLWQLIRNRSLGSFKFRRQKPNWNNQLFEETESVLEDIYRALQK